MILAPDKKFIFIHVPKAAGTSLNAALSMHDAFFPTPKRDLSTRRQRAESLGLPPATAQLGEHASVTQFVAALGQESFGTYYSFGFVRNPWDVAVSWFHYRLINPQVAGHAEAAAAATFQVYVRRCLTRPDAHQWVGLQHPYLVDEAGQVGVSFVGRYEALESDFARVAALLKIDTLQLDRFNQSYHPTWPELYTRETFTIVRSLVAIDAGLFGYPDEPGEYGIS